MSNLPITAEERARRAEALRQATASLRIEGLQTAPELDEIFDRYVNGQSSINEVLAALDEHYERKYGYVRLPRD